MLIALASARVNRVLTEEMGKDLAAEVAEELDLAFDPVLEDEEDDEVDLADEDDDMFEAANGWSPFDQRRRRRRRRRRNARRRRDARRRRNVRRRRNGNGTGSNKQIGNCRTVSYDTLNIGGRNRFHAVYIDCSGIAKTFTLKVDVKDMLGIHNCPLINDWEYTIGCPAGVCTINKEFTVSVDVCDVVAFIASAGAANLAKQVGSQAMKTAMGQGIKQMTNAQVRKVAAWGAQQAVKREVSAAAGGMCNDIGKFIRTFIQCLGGRGGALGAISSGIGALLKVINYLFGSLQFKVSFGTQFVLSTLRFQNWKTSFSITWNMGALAVFPRMVLTGVARTVSSVRDGSSCDNWDVVASAASIVVKFIPSVSASFKITCRPFSIFGISLRALGDGLKKAGEKVASFMKNMGRAIGDELAKFGEGFVRFFTGRPSSSMINTLKKVYHVRHMGCKDGCPGGWEHFYTSDKGCCKHFGSCFGDRKWCRVKKKYWEFGRRELSEEATAASTPATFEEDLALIESLNTLSDAQLEEFVATFPEEAFETALAVPEEELLADDNSQWVETHEDRTADEAAVEELVKSLEFLYDERENLDSEIELADDSEAFLADMGELMYHKN